MSLLPVLVVNDTRVDRHHGCHAVMAAILALLERNGMRAAHFWPAHADWRGDPEFDRALAEVRLVVVNGEGTIHHELPAGRRLLEVGGRARAQGVPVALINAGWEANGPDMVARLVDFDLVAARDSRSAKQMGAGGAEVRVVPDLSFWHSLALVPGPSADHPREGVGFTDNVERLKALELERLRRACWGKTLAISQAAPGCLSGLRFLRGGVSLRQDLRHPTRLAALLRLRRRLWRQTDTNHAAFLHRIAGFELLVSGRFHACTLALAMGTPVIAQSSNTGKIAALFHDAGLAPRRAALPLDTKAVREERARGWSRQERANLDLYLACARTAAETLFEDLSGLAGPR